MTNGIAVEMEVGESLQIGDVFIVAEQKSGRKLRLRVTAPRMMNIHRRKKENGAIRQVAAQSA